VVVPAALARADIAEAPPVADTDDTASAGTAADTVPANVDTTALEMAPDGNMPPTSPAPVRTTSRAARANVGPNSVFGV
ncbi:hypothetical protein, partial [Corallococcus aberystwythensis]|uniref:hypothetical protein n=1 Tax=Corallococcus aberystwythensis TaxID=2316722 RepID=UPI001ABF0566